MLFDRLYPFTTEHYRRYFYLHIGKLLCAMTRLSIIRSLKVRDNVIHKSFLVLIRRLTVSGECKWRYRMLISEIDLVNNTLSDLSGERVVFKEHIECFGDS